MVRAWLGGGQGVVRAWSGCGHGVVRGVSYLGCGCSGRGRRRFSHCLWFNWDQDSEGNDSGSKNSIQMNIETGTWFRATGNYFAAAICSKPIL